MVTFISGHASSGKTYSVYKRIEESANNNRNAVLIVPEQYSFESEKAMLDILGESAQNNVSVLPFSRIYETIGRETGGICGKVLTNADKHILINRAIASVSDELTLWGKYASSISFSAQMLKTVDEFKYAGITSADLREAAGRIKTGKLKSKLDDTALIYDAYTAVLGTAFLDPSDYMDRLFVMLEKSDFFKNKDVVFDGFKSFSGQQFKVIDRILSKAENVLFTFVDDKDDKRSYSLITNIRKTKNRIKTMLKSHNLPLEEVFLDKPIYLSKDMNTLEQALFFSEFSGGFTTDDVTLCVADTIYDEVEYTARSIRRIIREEGASFADFVVIARDTEMYEDALKVACKRNKVNIFIDKKIPLSSMPISSLVVSAIEYSQRRTTKSIFDFYKSGIAGLSGDHIAMLESYAYIWNIKDKDFDNEWKMNPAGFTDRISPEDEAELQTLNGLRVEVIKPLREFAANYRGTPKNRAAAIYKLLSDVNACEHLRHLAEYYESNGDEEYSNVLKRSYGEFMSLLDGVVACHPDVDISKSVFFDSLKTVLSLNSVGVTPQTLDEVVFGSADRIRPARPKYAFVLGVNQGIFPQTSASSGLFTNTDIRALKDIDLDVADKSLDLAVDEQLLIYSNLCCASNKVSISYTKTAPDNTVLFPSQFLSMLADMKIKTVAEPRKLDESNIPETFDSAFVERLKRVSFDPEGAKIVYDAIKDNEQAIDLDFQAADLSAENSKIDTELSKSLYGNEIYLSASKVEVYSNCKFKYFCEEIAKAKPVEKAEISSLVRGTMIHYVLEKIVESHKNDISAMTGAEIAKEVDFYCNEYLSTIPGFEILKNKRFEYIVYTVSRALKEVVERIAAEFAESDFKPVGCEIKIGKNDPVSVVMEIDDDCNLVLSGKIDRVDEYNGNIRIVDYKSTGKKFALSEILEGINMQMLIYLCAITKSDEYGSSPAGIIYSKASRNKKKESVSSGLIVADPEIVEAMEHGNNGNFIPKFKQDCFSDAYLSREDYSVVLDYVNEKLRSIGNELLCGNISAMPLKNDENISCKYCEFATVCRISDDVSRSVKKMTNAEIIAIMNGGADNAEKND